MHDLQLVHTDLKPGGWGEVMLKRRCGAAGGEAAGEEGRGVGMGMQPSRAWLAGGCLAASCEAGAGWALAVCGPAHAVLWYAALCW